MNILILGGTGMLGNAVAEYFSSTDYHTTITFRKSSLEVARQIKADVRIEYDPLKHTYEQLGETAECDFDYIINCIGTIKPFMASNPRDARYINSVFPWELATWANSYNAKLIHITTDCVYSGNKGSYVESDPHDALDDYGKSKSLGEPISDCMVIRTSIIGEEIHKHASLVDWAKTQRGKEVRGFTNHLWNGITTRQYAKVCHQIIKDDLWERGLFHVHASDVVNKLQMLEYFNEVWDLSLTINPFQTPAPCDRSLASEKTLCSKLNVPSVWEQIKQI